MQDGKHADVISETEFVSGLFRSESSVELFELGG